MNVRAARSLLSKTFYGIYCFGIGESEATPKSVAKNPAVGRLTYCAPLRKTATSDFPSPS